MARKKTTKQTLETTLDLKAIVFDGDRDRRKELEESRSLTKLWAAAAEAEEANFLLNFLKYHVQLRPKMAPHLFTSVERCRKALGMAAEIEIFCVQKGEADAYLSMIREGAVVLGISNHALKILDDAELRWVIGHQLGHALFDHLSMLKLYRVLDSDELAPIDRLRFFAWQRYAELTADRVGLLCAGSLDASISAMFKMASGLSDPRVVGNVKEVGEQFASLQLESSDNGVDDWLSTSPFGPLRVKALELFFRSKTFHKLSGQGPGELTEAQMEREVVQIVSVMDPSFLDEKGACVREKREFLVYGGMAVAMADDKVAKKELDAIKQLVGEGGILDKLDEAADMTGEQLGEKLTSLGNKLGTFLPLVRRQKLIEDLGLVAAADKKLMQSEANTLYQLSNFLGVDPSYVDVVLGRLSATLD